MLNAAARAADGDVVLKMDDDDWYAPDFVADLLRARAYSGAELVGMPDDALLPRAARPDRPAAATRARSTRSFVAGGTMLARPRGCCARSAASAPCAATSTPQLIAAVRAAGGAIYRTHGLGYVLRRTASGHTWQADLDDLLDPARVQATWPGLTPSRLMHL